MPDNITEGLNLKEIIRSSKDLCERLGKESPECLNDVNNMLNMFTNITGLLVEEISRKDKEINELKIKYSDLKTDYNDLEESYERKCRILDRYRDDDQIALEIDSRKKLGYVEDHTK